MVDPKQAAERVAILDCHAGKQRLLVLIVANSYANWIVHFHAVRRDTASNGARYVSTYKQQKGSIAMNFSCFAPLVPL